MRTTTAAQDLALSSKHYSTHFRIFVDRGSSDWVDLSDLEGYNWCKSVDYQIDEDNPVQRATIKLFRQAYNFSLSPLMDGSKLNQQGVLVDIANPIYVEACRIGQDATPTSSDWVEVHRGQIDSVDWADDVVTIQSRDDGGRLIDAFIEDQDSVYGTESGRDMEDVIQDILDDHATSATTLFSPNGSASTPFNPSDSPGFQIIPYNQDQETVMSAIRRIAQLIGADVGYKWHENTSAFKLVFQQPDRATSAQGTLNLSSSLPQNNETFVVNNTTFTAKTSGATTDEFNIGADQRETARSIVVMLNTGSETDNLWSYLDSNDDVVITWTPGAAGNSITFTESMTGTTADGSGTLGGTTAGADADGTVAHTFGADDYFGVRTLKISREDIRNKVRVDFMDSNEDKQTAVQSDATSIAKYGKRFMKITEGAGSQIDTFDEALKFAGAAIADLAEPNVDQVITTGYFWPAEIGDNFTFSANGQHYDTDQTLALVKVRHSLTRDKSRTVLTCRGKPSGGKKRWLRIEGRPGVAPVRKDKVTPEKETLVTQSYTALSKNDDMASFSGGKEKAPDNWNVTTGEWESGKVYYDDTEGPTGRVVMTLSVDSTDDTAVVESDMIPVSQTGLEYGAYLYARSSVAIGDDFNFEVSVRWYDVDKQFISENVGLLPSFSESGVAALGTTYSWNRSEYHSPPSDAVYATAELTATRTAGSGDFTIFIDRFGIRKSIPATSRRTSGVVNGRVDYNTVEFEHSVDYDDTGGSEHFDILIPGVYLITWNFELDDSSAFSALVLRNAGGSNIGTEEHESVAITSPVGNSHQVYVNRSDVVALEAGDEIYSEVTLNSGSTVGLVARIYIVLLNPIN